ncbi:hypothetical protein GGX14DRAFT_409010 [Mycena pura]|uniref:Uncharacterized protein n=1 Tax=Mycena pura TaxID=153505 RepID=A0AAD6Y2V2_9AGAR|nr:hypothetical protein GGX14DRAFT_409010 [Mycena pura]
MTWAMLTLVQFQPSACPTSGPYFGRKCKRRLLQRAARGVQGVVPAQYHDVRFLHARKAQIAAAYGVERVDVVLVAEQRGEVEHARVGEGDGGQRGRKFMPGNARRARQTKASKGAEWSQCIRESRTGQGDATVTPAEFRRHELRHSTSTRQADRLKKEAQEVEEEKTHLSELYAKLPPSIKEWPVMAELGLWWRMHQIPERGVRGCRGSDEVAGIRAARM